MIPVMPACMPTRLGYNTSGLKHGGRYKCCLKMLNHCCMNLRAQAEAKIPYATVVQVSSEFASETCVSLSEVDSAVLYIDDYSSHGIQQPRPLCGDCSRKSQPNNVDTRISTAKPTSLSTQYGASHCASMELIHQALPAYPQ